MTLAQIHNWFKTRVASHYHVDTVNVEVLISSPDDVKWVPAELADATVKYIHGKVPIAIEDLVGAMHVQSYGVVRERDTDNYFPWGEDRNTSGLLDQASTPDVSFKTGAEDYLMSNNIFPLTNSWQIIKTGEVGMVTAFRSVLTVLGNRTRENVFYVVKSGENYSHQIIENVKLYRTAEAL